VTECSACGFGNPDGARYCGHCGDALADAVLCSSCGARNPLENAYCNACGQALADQAPAPRETQRDQRSRIPERLAAQIQASRAWLEGERKQVTVLFADVVDSTKLAQRAGPEQWQQIMDRFFAILCDGVHRFEGMIDRFTGDGAMAVFGAPLADEQHALHACHAALDLSEQLAGLSAELRREQGLNLLVRIGLNSGEVVVGTIGEDLDIKYTAVGPTVALAKRMEGLAEPGKTYLTQTTAREVQGYFQLRDLGEFDVKGVDEPARVYELAGLGSMRIALELSRAHGLSRFVGRCEEIEALESALARAREGSGQVVCVVGEAGVGKSRLLYEFANRCRDERIEVWEGHCRARGETLALMPLLELLRAYFGTGDRDTGVAAREKITGHVLMLDPSLKDELPLLFELLGISDRAVSAARIDPEARQRRLFAMLNRIVAARSEQSVVVFLLEDLQWIDPGSATFVENLIDALPGTRALLLTSFRPEYQAEWMQRSYCARLAMAPLAAKPSRELLDDLLGSNPSLERQRNQIDARAGGNPFFIEELLRALVDDGNLIGERGAYRLVREIEEQAVPSTVQAVIAARLDRLGEREKQLLQTAAVIGHEFTEPVLSRVAGLSAPEARVLLRALLAGELIYERAIVPEPAYAFAHPLIEAVAYGSQLSDPRGRLHASVASVLENLYPDRLDELASLISYHHEHAGDTAAAARWGARAAAWVGFADVAGAMRAWRRVSQLADARSESPDSVAIGIWSRIAIMNFGYRLGTDEAEIANTFEQARDLAQRSGDLRSLAMVLGMYAHARTIAGDVAASVDLHLESIRIAEQAGDPALRAALVGAPLALFVTLRSREALEIMERPFALWAENPTLGSGLAMASPYAFCTWLRATIRLYLGELTTQAARAEIDRALAFALEHPGAEDAVQAYEAEVALSYWEGDGKTALEHANAAVELAEHTGSLFAHSHAESTRCLAHVTTGDWEAAITAGERALALAHRLGPRMWWRPISLARLADGYLGTGQTDRARRTATEAVAIAADQGSKFFELVARLALQRALAVTAPRRTEIAPGARTQLEANLARVEALIGRGDLDGYRAFLHEARARLAHVTGDPAGYVRELSDARRQWEAIGADPRAKRLSVELTSAADREPRSSPVPPHASRRAS
jgi:class 3 adenylate cyclase/tetratricopeptide (TPR) repeat protein